MPKKKFLRIVILAVCALMLVAAIIVFAVSVSSMSYKKTVKSYCSSLFTADFDTYWESLSSLEYGGVDFDSRYDMLGETYDAYLGLIASGAEAKTGEVKNVTVEFVSKEKMTRDELDELYGKCVSDSNSAATKADDIKSGKKINITVTIEGADNTVTVDINNLIVLKENKTWRVLSIESENDIAEKLLS